MNHFYWVRFRPLNLIELSEHLELSPKECRAIYLKWCNKYEKLATKFYYYQNERRLHFESNKRGEEEEEEYERQNNNREYKDDWREAVDIFQISIDDQQWLNSKQIYSGLSDLFEFDNSPDNIQLEKIKALWFNVNIISQSPAELDWLKSLDYRSGYLYTSHWEKVRAAMMLISDSSCKKCGDRIWLDRNYYSKDPQSRLHVHHWHYNNLGNERYEDLVLLCDDHHNIEHSKKAEE
jgi:5-methylcytosine-specific restriction endonuclease McrA